MVTTLVSYEDMREKFIEKSTAWFGYIVKCNDGTYYTGITKDPSKRLDSHESGKGAIFLRVKNKKPFEMRIVMGFGDMDTALDFEHKMKHERKSKKIAMFEKGRKVS
jgi:putative endonuclease